MAKLLKLRRGTTSQHSSFTGAEGEVTVDTTKDTIVVHDGSTAGGTALAKESAVTAIPAVIDEDNFATNSATRPPSQQSVKAYVDALPDVIDEDNMSSNSATRPPSQQSTKAYVDAADATKAPLASPALTGTATGVNLTLSGNLTVNGTTTTVATTNTTLTDNLLELNSGAGSNANDAGILIERGSTGDNAIIAWDESADKFTVGTTTGTASSTGNISITTGTLVANVEGNVTGDVTGNASGSAATVTGAAQSAITSVGTLTSLGITGNLTVDTNTLHVDATNNRVGIGTTSPDAPLTIHNSSDPEIRFGYSNTQDHRIAWDSSKVVIHADQDNQNNNSAVSIAVDGTTALTLDDSQNATFAGTALVNNRVQITGPSITDNQANGNNFGIMFSSTGIRPTNGAGTEINGTKDLGHTSYRWKDIYAGGVVYDSKGNLRSIPSNAQSSAYVAVAADAGKAVYISTGGVTINNSVFSAGDAVTIINNSGSDQTITKGSGVTLYNTADATDANRTLAQRGMATIWFASASVAYISGAGLS